MRVEASVVIDRPRGAVWHYLSTPSNTADYCVSMDRLKEILEGQQSRT